MRDLQFWQRLHGPPLLRIGAGFQYDMDENAPSLQARVRISDFATLRLLPQPVAKLRKSVPVPGTGLVLSVHYTCPLVPGLRSPLEPPARLLARLDNSAGSGLHFSPQGVEIDETVVALGDAASIRVAAGLAFPRQLPLTARDSFAWSVHRLGLKTKW